DPDLQQARRPTVLEPLNSPSAAHPPRLRDASRSRPVAREWRVRARPALLPVSERGRRETELGRELRLAEPHLRPNLPDVYIRHMHQGHADVIVLTARPVSAPKPQLPLSPTSRAVIFLCQDG